jgi:hypothetical protein
MKKIFAGLLTFAIGISAFNFVCYLVESYSDTVLSRQVSPVGDNEIYICSFFSNNETDKVKTENITPFFDSFAKSEYVNDEYQGFDGWFVPDEFKGMKEIWTLLLSRNSENSKNGKMTWNATLLTSDKDGSPKDEDNFYSTSIKTEKGKLSFETNKIRGIEYKFQGKFFKDGKDFVEDEKVLKGTLQKFVKGKKIAEFTADFSFYEPKCWH